MGREERTEFFRAKNARRRQHRGTAAYRQGRQVRRELANNGAFGNLSVDLFNRCAAGTSGYR